MFSFICSSRLVKGSEDIITSISFNPNFIILPVHFNSVRNILCTESLLTETIIDPMTIKNNVKNALNIIEKLFQSISLSIGGTALKESPEVIR